MTKKNSKIGICVSNGSIKSAEEIKKILEEKFNLLINSNFYNRDFFVAAVNGGTANCLNLGIIPNAIIGDMDSITTDVLDNLKNKILELEKDLNESSKNLNIKNNELLTNKIKFISYKLDKDESDTQLGVDYLIQQNFYNILLIGAFGNRADHSLANIFLLANPTYKDYDIRIITENSEIFILHKSGSIKGGIGKKVSIFSITPYTYFIKTSGLKFKLKEEKLLFSPVRGLSNIFTRNTARIDIREGKLLIIREL